MVYVIHACCVLHNMANIEDLQLFERPINDEEADPKVQLRHIIHDKVEREYETDIWKHDKICNEIIR